MYKIPYGEGYLDFNLSDEIDVKYYAPEFAKQTIPEDALVETAIKNPLGRDLPVRISPGAKIAIAISDLTRPVPNRIILPPPFNGIGEKGGKKRKYSAGGRDGKTP